MRAAIRVIVSLLLPALPSLAQIQTGVPVALRVVSTAAAERPSRAVVAWLDPVDTRLPLRPQGHYTLVQKNRTFIPHLLVVPVGSEVEFPNADPFFHNVFSLYQGKRFDLGLYEAGSSKAVTFGRPGVSYIFCNIHPEMSGIVIALTTPLYVVSSLGSRSSIASVPSGDYTLHVWAEGIPQTVLDTLSRRIHVSKTALDLGTIALPPAAPPAAHLNKFGKPYETSPEHY